MISILTVCLRVPKAAGLPLTLSPHEGASQDPPRTQVRNTIPAVCNECQTNDCLLSGIRFLTDSLLFSTFIYKHLQLIIGLEHLQDGQFFKNTHYAYESVVYSL